MTVSQANPQERPSENATERQVRLAKIISLLLTITLGVALASNFIAYLSDNSILLRLQLVTLLTISSLIGLVLALKGSPIRSAMSMIVAQLIILPLFIAETEGIGILLGAFALTVPVGIASLTLPSVRFQTVLIAAIISALVAIVGDLYWPIERVHSFEINNNNIIALVAPILGAIFLGFITLRNFSSYSLGTKLVTATILVAALAVITVAFSVNSFTRRTLTVKAGEQLDNLAESQAALVGELLFRELTTLQALSLSDSLLADLAERNASYRDSETDIETQLLALDESWQAASRTHPMVTAVLQSPLSAELKQFQTNFPENSTLLVTDQYGAVLAASGRTDQYFYAEDEWWQDAYSSGFGATSFSNPTVNPLNGDGVIEISLPLFTTQQSGRKRVSGVLYAAYSLAALEDLLVEAQYGETGQTRLHVPGFELAINENNQLSINQKNILSNTELTFILASEADVTFIEQDEETALVAAELVNTLNHQPIVDDLNWLVTVRQTEAEAFAAVQDQQQLNILLGTLVVLVAGGVAAFVGQRLTQPILQLTAVAEKVTAGDLTAQVDVQTQDEIGTLGHTLNSMTTQLRESIATLEDRVQERTRALETSIEVGRQLSTILDPQTLVESVVDQVRDAFNYYHAHIYLLDADEETLLLAGGTGKAAQEMLANEHKLAVGQGLVGQAAFANQVVLVPDVTQAKEWLPNPLLPDTKAEVAVPIALGNKLLGVLDVQHNIVNGLQQEDANALMSVTSQVAIALENARLLERVSRQAGIEAQINLIGQQIQKTTSIEEAMQIAVRELGRVTKAQQTSIQLTANKTGANGH